MEATDDAIIHATRHEIVAYGIRRATMGSIAKRAGISRATLYRRAGTMDELVREALVRELTNIVSTLNVGTSIISRGHLVKNIVQGTELIRHNELLGAILTHDAELLLPYITERLGRSQEILLDALTGGILAAQRNHTVREGDPHVLALGLLQSLTGFVMGQRLISNLASDEVWRDELTHLVNGYLMPSKRIEAL